MEMVEQVQKLHLWFFHQEPWVQNNSKKDKDWELAKARMPTPST
jgi:hypothetical protein